MPAAPGWISRLKVIGAVFALALMLTAADIAIDGAPDGYADLALDFVDRLVLLGAVAVLAGLVSRTTVLESQHSRLQHDIARVSQASEDWRRRSRGLLEGLSAAVGQQFDDWRLTAAEAEIAGLLLKGLSLRDIAVLRRTSDATIRQQAQGVYRKSGLANRAELSAYFLEDLFDVAEAAVQTPPPDRAALN